MLDYYLDDYLQSQGSELPPNFEDFRGDGQFGHLCVLCQSTNHESYAVFKFGIRTSIKTFSGVYACSECNRRVKSVIEEMFDGYTSSQDTKKRLDKWNTTGLLSSGHESFDNLDFRELVLSMGNGKTAVSSLSNYCYFCRNRANDGLSLKHKIQGATPYITSGSVSVCDRCFRAANAEAIEIGGVGCSCPNCGSIYYIDQREVQNRNKKAKTVPYICSYCAISNLLDEHQKIDSLVSDVDPLARNVRHKCISCNTTIDVDLYTDGPFLSNYLDDLGNKLCLMCSIHTTHTTEILLDSESRILVVRDDSAITLLMQILQLGPSGRSDWATIMRQEGVGAVKVLSEIMSLTSSLIDFRKGLFK